VGEEVSPDPVEYDDTVELDTAGKDTDTDDTARLVDTGDSRPMGCPVPVPDHVALGAPARGVARTHFYVPHAGWALATALASRKLAPIADANGLDPSAAGLLAMAVEGSAFGCGVSERDLAHPPADWTRDPSTDAAGCLALDRAGVWGELCRLYPQAFRCDAYDDVISAADGSDRVEPGVLAAAHFLVAESAILQAHGITTDWVAASADPYARTKLLAVALREGPWSPTFARIAVGCQDRPIEACIADASTVAFTVAMTAHRDDLNVAASAGDCYDATLTREDVGAFVDDLAEAWPAVRAHREAAIAATVEGPFQQAAPAVLEVLTRATPPLRCPDEALRSWYGIECP
jgi:hypothetical protein